jgi:hypothetical protein
MPLLSHMYFEARGCCKGLRTGGALILFHYMVTAAVCRPHVPFEAAPACETLLTLSTDETPLTADTDICFRSKLNCPLSLKYYLLCFIVFVTDSQYCSRYGGTLSGCSQVSYQLTKAE